MNATAKMLFEQYRTAIIPIETVCQDYFRHLTVKNLSEKMARGEIRLPLTRIEDSKRAAKGVHVIHLAKWIDNRMAMAEKESRQLSAVSAEYVA